MAEYLLTGARAVVKIDPSLQPAEVAALADAGLTAYHAVKKAVPLLPPGSRAVIIGAGGLGHIGIQSLAALTAAEMIVVDAAEPALDLARSIGAEHTVLADGSQVEQVMELTDGHGAEVGCWTSSASRARRADAWGSTRDAGSHYVIGYGGTVQIPTLDIISTERNIIGNLVGSYNELVELMALAAKGKVALHTRTYALGAVNDATDDLEQGRLQGRGILVPNG